MFLQTHLSDRRVAEAALVAEAAEEGAKLQRLPWIFLLLRPRLWVALAAHGNFSFMRRQSWKWKSGEQPWLQELGSDSRVTWDNYVTMSLTDMKEMNLDRLERGVYMADMVTVTPMATASRFQFILLQVVAKIIGIAVDTVELQLEHVETKRQNAFPLSANGMGDTL